MCIAVTIDQGGFIEPDNAISVTGLSSGVEKDRVRASARKLALPLALATMPDVAFEQTSHGWKWVVDGWSPGITMLTGSTDRDQVALLEELRRRCGPKWWSIYLPRIKKTAEIVGEAPTDWSTRRVITTLVRPATHVGRTHAYADMRAARELGLLRPTEESWPHGAPDVVSA
ncbi:hypothetical protein [Streptomyces sp. NBC_01546]|uniref:hypothetical protein n=1 Tax=Streptomyces sp. NBC_01546 TaxID=2975872 RepID=UPI002F91AC26